MIQAYRTVLVPVPGTPIQVTGQEAAPDDAHRVHGVLIQVLRRNVGRVFIGDKDMDAATDSHLFATLGIPTSNSIPSFQAALTLAPASIQLRDFWVDAEKASDGVLVTILVA